MTRKVTVPKPVSEYIGTRALTRALIIKLLTRIHVDIASEYDRYRHLRVRGYEDSLYRYRFVIEENGIRHLFTFTIDDATSPDHLIVASIRHDVMGNTP